MMNLIIYCVYSSVTLTFRTIFLRKGIYILVLGVLTSCNLYTRKEEVLITDKDFIENYRELSPDSSMVLINYSIDLGAFGVGQSGTSILKIPDTTKNLREFNIPNNYTQVKWIDNQNISAMYDILPSLREGVKFEPKDLEINKIKVHVSALDYIDQGSQQQIVHREVSPNGRYELVVYRYSKDINNLNFIHISVIQPGKEIPKYGNYFIADPQSDYVFYGTWTKESELVFYSNSQDAELVEYFLVHKRPKVKYNIIRDDQKYSNKYRWIERGSDLSNHE